jgi:hypothetical protein
MTISIDQVTTTVPSGNGVFDVLMRSVDSHLDKQYVSGRIKGSDYATVYLGALQAVLQQAIQFTLMREKTEVEIDAVQETIDQSKANTIIKQQQGDAQAALLARQTEGFDDDHKYKVFNSLLGLRTTGMTQGIIGLEAGAGSTGSSANALANALLADAGITGITDVINDTVV